MLIDTEYLPHKDLLLVSYVDEHGNNSIKKYNWSNPQKYVVAESLDTDTIPDLHSWKGDSVKLIPTKHPDRYSVYEFLDALPDSEKEEIFKFNKPRTFFIDIETEIVDGFPEAKDALSSVLAISIVYEDKLILMGLKPLSTNEQNKLIDDTNDYFKETKVEYKFKYYQYVDEFDMLYDFFNVWVPKMPMISGWNIVDYDWVYLVNRCRKVSKMSNGVELRVNPAVSSPTRKLESPWGREHIELPKHRLIFDYMQMYKIFDTKIKVKESASLDFVAQSLTGVNKIKFQGSLQKLYEQDFLMYMYYNAVDSILVQKIHDKMAYIDIAYAISSLARIKLVDVVSKMKDALGSLPITEGVLRNRYRDQSNVVLFREGKTSDVVNTDSIAGGWVKDPIKGWNHWVAIFDFASLYPSVQRQFFISPENFVGVVTDSTNKEAYNDGTKEITTIDLSIHVVCVNGCVFRKENSPFIKMLTDIFADRKKSKGVMMHNKELVNTLQKEKEALLHERELLALELGEHAKV
jgi:DNA polymerase elongation subunit (family B)